MSIIIKTTITSANSLVLFLISPYSCASRNKNQKFCFFSYSMLYLPITGFIQMKSYRMSSLCVRLLSRNSTCFSDLSIVLHVWIIPLLLLIANSILCINIRFVCPLCQWPHVLFCLFDFFWDDLFILFERR